MRFLNFGSLNLDYTYFLPHIVAPGETIASSALEVFPGGKGLNQSVALARAGAEVYHAGLVGEDGAMLLDVLSASGADVSNVGIADVRSGNAIIQVSESGENSIILFGGANQAVSPDYANKVLSAFGEGDCLLLQNEISSIAEMIDEAAERGMKIVLNPSPFRESLLDCALDKVGLFLINEVEGQQITGESEAGAIIAAMLERFPKAELVLTMGSKGAVFANAAGTSCCESFKVKAVDTTGAGDTFTGFFLRLYLGGNCPAGEALRLACKAAAIAVTRKGAAPSIPTMEEVINTAL